jgi:hypothetical protein
VVVVVVVELVSGKVVSEVVVVIVVANVVLVVLERLVVFVRASMVVVVVVSVLSELEVELPAAMAAITASVLVLDGVWPTATAVGMLRLEPKDIGLLSGLSIA